MTTDYAKPLPEITEDNRPFWEGCKQHKLLLQRCSKCNHRQGRRTRMSRVLVCRPRLGRGLGAR